MSDLIVIVGTCHVFQRPPPTRREEAAKLREYLVRLARRHNAKAVGEELSMETLRELERSTCAEVALELGLTHRYCDPTQAERSAMNLPEGRGGFELRERFWLARMRELNEWPAIFVCGANHVRGFKRLIAESGLTPKVARRDWQPNYALLSEATRLNVIGSN